MLNGCKFYTFWRSSTAWRVRIALNLKKLEPEYHFVNLDKGEHRSESYSKINPNNGVPSLVLSNGTVLIESMAIIEYLNRVKPQPNNLFPGLPDVNSQIRGFCEVINSGIHPYQNMRLVEKVAKDYGADQTQWCVDWTTRGIQTIERFLAQKPNTKYVFSDVVTAADVFFYPQVLATKQRWGLDLSPYSNVSRVLANLEEIHEFKQAEPANQKDCDA